MSANIKRKLQSLPSHINGLEIVHDLGMNQDTPPKREAIFICDCGQPFKGKINAIKTDQKLSCGCKRGKSNLSHGLSGHPLYKKWSGMITRTTNSNENCYSRYGGRGISICDEWRNDFMAFYSWAIGNGYKQGLTIDRIDVNGDYEPNNCQWLTMKENSLKDRKSEFLRKNKAEEICNKYEARQTTVTELARQYGTYKDAISTILNNCNIKIDKNRRLKRCITK